MTPQKAIKFFDDEILRLNNAPKLNGCEMTDEWKEQLEICKMAKSAIEEQIPKKPIEDGYPWAICPVCYGSVHLVNVQEHIHNKESSRCEHCGQALDWRDS